MSQLTDELLDMRHKTNSIRNTFKNTGTIEPEDLEFLIDQALRHVIMTGIAESDWCRLQILKTTSTLEIQELVRQVETK